MDIDYSLEELKAQIRLYSADGNLGAADRQKLRQMAERAGLSEHEFDVLVHSVILNGQPDEDDGGFSPKVVHFVVAALVLVVLSVFVYIGLDDGGRYSGQVFRSQSDVPIKSGDLACIFSGNYDGKAILVNVKEVREEDSGMVVLVFDLKCDFVSVATGCICMVDLDKNTFSFQETEATKRKVPLGSGSVVRTPAGKIVLKPGSGVYELVQL